MEEKIQGIGFAFRLTNVDRDLRGRPGPGQRADGR